jgi:hypothetical protein
MNWFKRHKIVSIAIFLIATGLALVIFLPNIARGIVNMPLAVFDVKRCDEPTPYYLDEQVVRDEEQLEGYFERLQEKEEGLRQYCWHYRSQSSVTTVIKKPVPSIVKVGIRKFQEPKLLAIARSAGIIEPLNKEPVSVYYVDRYTDLIWAAGTYSDYKKAITVKAGGSDQRRILAHEYLHYVWYRDSLESDSALVTELTSFYNRSPGLQDRMVNYDSGMRRPTEFFSYVCTEWSDRWLTSYVLEKCNHYIDRSKLSKYY